MIQKFNFFVFTVILGAQMSGQAADPVLAKYENDSAQIAVADSSAANRENKKFSLFAELSMGTTDSSGFSASYFLDSLSQIQIDYYNHTLPVTAKVVNAFFGGSNQLNGVSTGAHYKKFLGNSFFLRGGLDHRRVELTKSNTFFSGTAVNAVVAIGNEWQWQHITLGFDWFRGYLPLTSRITEEKFATAAQQKTIEDDQNSFLRKPSATIGMRLGASF